MPKIPNWSKANNTTWDHDNSDAILIVVKKSKEMFTSEPGYIIVLVHNAERKRVTDSTYHSKRRAITVARNWMKANPSLSNVSLGEWLKQRPSKDEYSVDELIEQGFTYSDIQEQKQKGNLYESIPGKLEVI